MQYLSKSYDIGDCPNLVEIHQALEAYYEETKVEPGLVELGRESYLIVCTDMFNAAVSPFLDINKRHVIHLNTGFGLIPIVPTDLPRGKVRISVHPTVIQEIDKVLLS